MIKLTKTEVLWLKKLVETKGREIQTVKNNREYRGEMLEYIQLQEDNYISLKNKLENVLKTKAKRIEIK